MTTLPANVVPLRQSPKNAEFRKPRNSEVRDREYLTPDEVGKLLKAARKLGRHGVRDHALLLVCYRHGLRVSELVSLKWSQVDFAQGLLHVERAKRGTPSVHPIQGDVLRALRSLHRATQGRFVFTTERGGPLVASSVRRVVQRAGEAAGLGSHVHPHQLRHACGYALANANHPTRSIQHYMGHKNPAHTARYCELASGAFEGFWRD